MVLGVLVLYLVLPLVIESFIAGGVQTVLRTTTRPDVEVRSTFPPMMLLGRIGTVEVTGPPSNPYYVRADGVRVSVPNLIVGGKPIKAESCSPAIPKYIDQIDCQQVG